MAELLPLIPQNDSGWLLNPTGRQAENTRRHYQNQIYISQALAGSRTSAYNAAQRDKYMKEYQSAYNEAKAANETRYQDILSGYGSRYNEAMGTLGNTRAAVTGKLASNRTEVMSNLQNLGDAELAGIGRRYTKERASVAQGLISSGLHSTTVAPAVQGGVNRREGYAMAEAQERLRREKLGYISQLGSQELQSLKELSEQELMAQTGLKKEELDFMERREDEYPSESLYVQLMMELGGS